ncbi:hypothetical protein H4P12_07525 [Paracoccus sp. 11-3]|uniref:Uncharacterized protein n=1 Tax=Paracoccus amoyensis TaxID=2760093 RepID=A0A926JCN3_9RHOB|nr:hypothetical protein [Paracoccus amoyensis]MBC9246564.1 hypothetical protein [Paracoccus amoyensis]
MTMRRNPLDQDGNRKRNDVLFAQRRRWQGKKYLSSTIFTSLNKKSREKLAAEKIAASGLWFVYSNRKILAGQGIKTRRYRSQPPPNMPFMQAMSLKLPVGRALTASRAAVLRQNFNGPGRCGPWRPRKAAVTPEHDRDIGCMLPEQDRK